MNQSNHKCGVKAKITDTELQGWRQYKFSHQRQRKKKSKKKSADGELVGQIGDGEADHAWWGRPEEMTMNRSSSVQLVPDLKSSARMLKVITIMSEPQAEKIQMVPHGLN